MLSELLGRIRLADLRASHIEEALAGLPWSPHTIAGLRSVLRTALSLAVRDRLIPDNPAALARLRTTGARREPPTADDVRRLIRALEGHRLQPLIVLLATTGLRLGEALGLRWSDIEDDRLHVRWQLVRAPADADEPYALGAPKTPSSRRTVLLPPVAREALRQHRLRQAEELLALGIGRPAHDLVFTSHRGGPLAPSTVYAVLEATGSRVRPHDLRRFAATVAAGTGDLLAAQALLGHASARLTSERYAATTEAALRRAADAAQEVLG
jgi:integrase